MGKVNDINEKFIREKLDPKQGQKRTEIIAYPAKGYDYSIIGISDEKVMGMASDDAIFLSGLTPDKSAYLTFHRSADKLGASGIVPEYIGVNLHLPDKIEEDVIAHFWNSLNIESKKFQAAITGRSVRASSEAREPFVGGTTSVGTSRKAFYVTPEGANDGDRILMSKTSGLEVATILSHIFPEYVEEKVGQYNHRLAQKLFFKTSTLQEIQEAIKFGLGKNGITSMVNLRDRGIIGALNQFSESGQLGVEVDFEKIPVYDEVRDICQLFGLDPYFTNSMGSILMTMQEDVSEDFIKELVGNGIDVVDIGKVKKDSNMVRIAGLGDKERIETGPSQFYDLLQDFREKIGN